MLGPDLYVRSVHDIDLGELKRQGIDSLLIDLDNTLLPRDTNVVPKSLKRWSDTVREDGFGVCLVSNNWHERVHAVAEELGFQLVSKAVKPLPFAFRAAMRKLEVTRERCVIIGDQVFTDVLGGKLSGVRTILVTPLSTTDLPHTLMLRRLEAQILRGREPILLSEAVPEPEDVRA